MPQNRSREHGEKDLTHASQSHRKNHYTHRPRSPHNDDDRHRHKRRRTRSPPAKAVELPYNANPLSRRNFDNYRPLFESYLDIQKQIQLDDLDEREVKGRWKSFISRWNRGDLARSWYDPSMLKTAHETVQSYHVSSPQISTKRASPHYEAQGDAEQESDDEFGPAPPADLVRPAGQGPTIPRFDDLAHRDTLRSEDRSREHTEYVETIRQERKADRKSQKERLEELAPRADPGSRERQLEKKRETTSTLQSFRDAKESGDVEIPEADLMGDDGVDQLKRQKRDMERQKNEREIRREEIARAREAARNEALAARREKESKTMDFLKQIARERFG